MPLAARLLIVLIGLAACIPPTVTTTTAASTTAESTTTVAVMACGYALFDGTAGSKISTPNHGSLNITGDIDLRILAWVDTEGPPGTNDFFISKGAVDIEATQAAFAWYQQTDGTNSILAWQQDDESAIFEPSGDGYIAFDVWRWYRVTLDVNDGAGNSVIAFYNSNQAPETAAASIVWNPFLVNPLPGISDINSSVDDVLLGTMKLTTDIMRGRIGYAEIRNGINSIIVADPDFRNPIQKTGDSPTTFTDGTGKVWTFTTAIWVPGDCGGGGQDENRMGGTGAIRKPPRTR